MKEKSIKNLDMNSRIQASQEVRLKNIDETRNYFLEKKKQNELMSRKHKKVCATLNNIEHFLILGDIACISTSAFTSLLVIPIEITSSVIALKFGAIAIGKKSISQ